MKQIKICFISTNAYPLFSKKKDAVHGGSELQLYMLSKELCKNTNFDISFIVGNFNQKKVEIINEIKLYRSFNPKKSDNMIKKLYQAMKYLLLFKKINADIYFTSAPNSTIGLVSFFCKLNDKRHLHRTAHESEVNLSYSNKGILGKIFIKGLESSDLIIVQNESHRKLLRQNHGIGAEVLRNSFAVKSFIVDMKDIIKKKSILWVARCDYWKRPELFIKLAECFPNEKFIMIAPTVNEKEDYHRKIKSKASVVKNLTFIAGVPFNKIQKYFDDAKVFVNTSEYEGFPNTFLQAGIGKTPIISLSVNPDNFINEYDCGFYCENRFDKFIESITILMYDNTTWCEKSDNVLNYVKKNHDIHKNVEQLTNWIYALVD